VESGVKRNILGHCGNAPAKHGNSGWQARCRAGRI
jgi:hypothetical protein